FREAVALPRAREGRRGPPAGEDRRPCGEGRLRVGERERSCARGSVQELETLRLTKAQPSAKARFTHDRLVLLRVTAGASTTDLVVVLAGLALAHHQRVGDRTMN